MELIGIAIDKIKTLGVPDHEMFQTVDLYEAQNLHQVVINLSAVARKVPPLSSYCPHIVLKLSLYCPHIVLKLSSYWTILRKFPYRNFASWHFVNFEKCHFV